MASGLGEHAQLSMHGSFLVDPLIKLLHAHYRLEKHSTVLHTRFCEACISAVQQIHAL